ncbi:hypothetical protein ACC862_37820, partial [Rhizobium ruizarguesonis]
LPKKRRSKLPLIHRLGVSVGSPKKTIDVRRDTLESRSHPGPLPEHHQWVKLALACQWPLTQLGNAGGQAGESGGEKVAEG